MNEIKLRTKNMATENSQPGLLSSLRWNGKHTPVNNDDDKPIIVLFRHRPGYDTPLL